MISWAATAEMVARRWTAGDVPTSYARNTLAKGARQTGSAVTKLDRASAPDDPLARSARADYRKLAAMLARMGDAVEKGNKAEIGRLAGGLPAIEQQIGQSRSRCRARMQARSS
ncbi:MAG TPA: hypothetical protein VFL92_05495 [Sphingomonas sp.]|nr:hypothetical protein [Sphingomonas sp.]